MQLEETSRINEIQVTGIHACIEVLDLLTTMMESSTWKQAKITSQNNTRKNDNVLTNVE